MQAKHYYPHNSFTSRLCGFQVGETKFRAHYQCVFYLPARNLSTEELALNAGCNCTLRPPNAMSPTAPNEESASLKILGDERYD